MNLLDEKIEKIEDKPTRDALAEISKYFKKLDTIPPVNTEPTIMARALNKIIGKL